MQAIYVRQSVDKKDSISIETQIERCKARLTPGEDFSVFSDKGYSGKSTDRPRFQEMMSEVRNGCVSRIIIYKFDRITRSLLDFVTMQADFEHFGVELISCEENFDTSNPMGKMIVNILMTFAEMERETIQKRIKDNYYARGEKGMYLGGYAPFGYEKVETLLEGKKTYTFKENTKESLLLRQMYHDYAGGKSLGEIARALNRSSILTRKGKPWNNTCVARILKNPVYVKANADVYHYLADLGGTMNNPVEEYTGEKGCYIYGDIKNREGAKFVNLKNDYVTLGLHEGIIEPSLWLEVQSIFHAKKGHSNLGTGSLSWLQGLVKCGCGYTCYVKRCRSKRKEHRYFYCRGRKNNTCPFPKNMLLVETLEAAAEEALLSRLKQLQDTRQHRVIKDTPKINALKIQVSGVENKIQTLIEQLAEGSQTTAGYINAHIEKLDRQKQELWSQIEKLELDTAKTTSKNITINDILAGWPHYHLETKKKIAKEAIEKIVWEGKTVSIVFY